MAESDPNNLPQESVKKLLDNQTRELEIRAQETKLREKELDQNHEIAVKSLEAQEKWVNLTLEEEAEWLEYFQKQKAKADDLKSQIAQTDKEIDAMVYELYELYGLGGEEVKVVEGNGHQS